MNKNYIAQANTVPIFPAISKRMTLSVQELAAALIGILGPLAQLSPIPAALLKEGTPQEPRPFLDAPGRVVEQIPNSVKIGKKEHFLAFYLNSRNQMIHFETVSIGTLSASLVHPREVFAPAIEATAAALIVAHNHPSGDCAPSPEDKVATRRLKESGELLGIPLLDHLIVSSSSFFSFRENGLLS
jgi:DNA repair protein RadC